MLQPGIPNFVVPGLDGSTGSFSGVSGEQPSGWESVINES